MPSFEKPAVQPVEVISTENRDNVEQIQRLQKAREEVERIVDGLGRGIDENIKECVVALKFAGISTMQSCEGHLDEHGFPVPWVLIGSNEQPNERYVGQNEMFQKIANERNVDVQDVKSMNNLEAYQEVMQLVSSNEESQQFKDWEKSNAQLYKKVSGMVETFYQELGEPTNPEARIQFANNFVGDFCRMYSGGSDYQELEQELTDNERIDLEKRLVIYRAEMNRFAQYLIEKY